MPSVDRGRSFILSSPRIWKNIYIDWCSPFSGEWKKTGLQPSEKIDQYGHVSVTHSAKMEKCGRTMIRFTGHLTDITNSTENFKTVLSHSGYGVTDHAFGVVKSLHKLLINQKKIVSLSLNLCRLGFSDSRSEEFDCFLMQTISKHQSTLEQLDLSETRPGLSLTGFGKYLLSTVTEFPNLRLIGTLSKPTPRPRGGGQHANFHSETLTSITLT